MKAKLILAIFLLGVSFFSLTKSDYALAAPPTVGTLSPADNATNVQLTDNLVITFSAAVDATTGNIVIYRASDDSVFETIPVTDGRVTGSGTTTITINPNSNFNKNTSYYVHIANTAFENAGDEAYAGINNTTSWNFTTINSGSSGMPSIPMCTISTDKSALVKGESAQLTVMATGQNLDNYYFRLENTGQDLGPTNNKVTVSPMVDTTYKIFVINQFGANSCEQKITVMEKAPEPAPVQSQAVMDPTVTVTPVEPAPVVVTESMMPAVKSATLDFTRTLRRQRGMSNEVKSLQQVLNMLGNAGLVADGSFGRMTETAVRNWQSQNGLRPDGVVGPMTRRAMEAKIVEMLNQDSSKKIEVEHLKLSY